jgi:HK97 family phage prohead protease
MKRTDLMGIEREATRRRLTAPFELRKDSSAGGQLTFRGYASTTETDYPVFGGSYPGWQETIVRGAFKKTLRENADVSFLINHEGMTLARTKSGTMQLREDNRGLAVTATLDPSMNAVNDLYKASQRGDIDEMSFAFRVTRDEWFDDAGNRSNEQDGTKRRILEVNLNKGDVSAVNYGANDTTSGGFRDVELALAELRDGREISDGQRDVIRRLARAIGEAPEQRATAENLDQFANYFKHLQDAVEAMGGHLNELIEQSKIGPDGTFTDSVNQNAVTLGPGIETVAAMRALHERLREPVA